MLEKVSFIIQRVSKHTKTEVMVIYIYRKLITTGWRCSIIMRLMVMYVLAGYADAILLSFYNLYHFRWNNPCEGHLYYFRAMVNIRQNVICTFSWTNLPFDIGYKSNLLCNSYVYICELLSPLLDSRCFDPHTKSLVDDLTLYRLWFTFMTKKVSIFSS